MLIVLFVKHYWAEMRKPQLIFPHLKAGAVGLQFLHGLVYSFQNEIAKMLIPANCGGGHLYIFDSPESKHNWKAEKLNMFGVRHAGFRFRRSTVGPATCEKYNTLFGI